MLNTALEYAEQTRCFTTSFRPSGFLWLRGVWVLLVLRIALPFLSICIPQRKENHNWKEMLHFLGLIFINGIYKINAILWLKKLNASCWKKSCIGSCMEQLWYDNILHLWVIWKQVIHLASSILPISERNKEEGDLPKVRWPQWKKMEDLCLTEAL